MVVLGTSAGISTGKLFLGVRIPGIIMGLALMVSIFVQSRTTKEGKNWPVTKIPAKEIPVKLLKAVPALMSPVIIIGGITTGVFTPTEAAIVAIDYSIILGIVYKELTFRSFMQALKDAVETSGTFMLIIAIAGFFTWIIKKDGLATVLQNMLSPLYSAGPVFVLLVLAVILVIVGCFMDTTAAILLITPIFMPIINNLEMCIRDSQMGVKIEHNVDERDLFSAGFGDIICEVKAEKVGELAITYTLIGEVTDKAAIEYKDVKISMAEALETWKTPLEKLDVYKRQTIHRALVPSRP